MSTGQTYLIGGGLVHPGPFLRLRVSRLVRTGTGRSVSSVWVSDSPRLLRDTPPQPVIAYFHRPADAPRIVDSFADFAARGGALIAVHGALASFKGNGRWEQLLGVRFSGHGPVEELAVSATPGGVRLGVDVQTPTIRDEQYYFTPVSDTVVLATADSGGNPSPTLWTRDVGAGRVVCLALGHNHRAVGSPVFRSLLVQALVLAEGAP